MLAEYVAKIARNFSFSRIPQITGEWKKKQRRIGTLEFLKRNKKMVLSMCPLV